MGGVAELTGTTIAEPGCDRSSIIRANAKISAGAVIFCGGRDVVGTETVPEKTNIGATKIHAKYVATVDGSMNPNRPSVWTLFADFAIDPFLNRRAHAAPVHGRQAHRSAMHRKHPHALGAQAMPRKQLRQRTYGEITEVLVIHRVVLGAIQ